MFLNENICYGYSKEPSQLDGSFEQPKHIFYRWIRKYCKFMQKKKSNWLLSEMKIWILAPVLRSLKITYNQVIKIGAKLKKYFLISQPKHMLWVLKRTISFLEYSKHIFETDG